MKAGAAAAGLTVIVMDELVSAPEAFAAFTVKLNDPATVGVPDSAPPTARLSPVGRAPLSTANVGVGYPEALKV